MRKLLLTLAALVLVAPLDAQAQARRNADPDDRVAGGGTLPAGWQVRLDRPNASLADVKFVAEGSGFHATLGPAAVFYNPRYTAKGEYRAKATFTQTKAARHPEAYGLVFGGRDLDNEKQDYMYFLIRQDGKYLVKHRAGAETHTIVDWTDHPAIKKIDAQGKATNALEVAVGAREVRFLVNGVEVRKLERVPYMNTDGLVALRINHNLDVQVTGFAVETGNAGHAGHH